MPPRKKSKVTAQVPRPPQFFRPKPVPSTSNSTAATNTKSPTATATAATSLSDSVPAASVPTPLPPTITDFANTTSAPEPSPRTRASLRVQGGENYPLPSPTNLASTSAAYHTPVHGRSVPRNASGPRIASGSHNTFLPPPSPVDDLHGGDGAEDAQVISQKGEDAEEEGKVKLENINVTAAVWGPQRVTRARGRVASAASGSNVTVVDFANTTLASASRSAPTPNLDPNLASGSAFGTGGDGTSALEVAVADDNYPITSPAHEVITATLALTSVPVLSPAPAVTTDGQGPSAFTAASALPVTPRRSERLPKPKIQFG